MSRILVVEDEQRIASFVAAGLRRKGFRVDVAGTGPAALAMVREGGVDLLLLDVGLPGMDGFEVLRQLRAQGWSMPVIVLTARGSLADRVAGLEGGADDYMPKPFSMAELLARIRLRLATSTTAVPAPVDTRTSLAVGPVRLDLRTRQVRVHQRVAELSAREFALLEVLMRHAGEVVTRAELLEQVWKYAHTPGSTNVVDVYVGYVRRKLGPGVIETVRGAGYRLGDPAPAPAQDMVPIIEAPSPASEPRRR